MEKYSEKDILNLNEAHIDIESAEILAFQSNWHGYKVEIPMDFVDFSKIHLTVKTYTPEVLSKWSEKMVPSKELEDALGFLSELMIPFVDYMNMMRRTLVLQYLHTFVKTGYLDVTLDSEGKEQYIEKKDSYHYEYVEKIINEVLKAKENHIG